MDAEALGRDPVVVIPVGDQLSVAHLAGQVALCTDGQPLCEMHVVDALIVRYEVGDGVLSIVDDDELARWIILAQKVPDGLAHKSPPIAGRHDATHQRCGCHLESRVSPGILFSGGPTRTPIFFRYGVIKASISSRSCR